MNGNVTIFEPHVVSADQGSYFIPNSILVTMGRDELDRAEVAVDMLLDENPEYVFSVISEIESDGITVHWRRIK